MEDLWGVRLSNGEVTMLVGGGGGGGAGCSRRRSQGDGSQMSDPKPHNLIAKQRRLTFSFILPSPTFLFSSKLVSLRACPLSPNTIITSLCDSRSLRLCLLFLSREGRPDLCSQQAANSTFAVVRKRGGILKSLQSTKMFFFLSFFAFFGGFFVLRSSQKMPYETKGLEFSLKKF